MKEIISLWETPEDGYIVGQNGITKIIPAEKNGQMAKIIYYEIYKGDTLYIECHSFSTVIYKVPQ